MAATLRRTLILLLALLVPARAGAEVEIAFYSKEFGASFPHAFVRLEGTIEATGEEVDANYGFTVKHLIGPSVLFGPVQGVVISESPGFVARSRRHFAMRLGDEQYRSVMALVEKWRALPQPSYSLDRRNCVSFVAEVAALLGLSADPRGSMRRPRKFLDRVARDNAQLIAAASARAPASPR